MGMLIRLGIMVVSIATLFFLFFKLISREYHSSEEENEIIHTYSETSSPQGITELYPEFPGVELVSHKYYSLGYSEADEISLWAAHILRKDDLRKPNVKRTNYFLVDSNVKNGSADYYDYSGTGFTRGHLVPAGDMAFNELAMTESFYMSNICPQERGFNAGVWRELEESVRDWAYLSDSLFILTGPVLDSTDKYIGKKHKIRVPGYFYKALLQLKPYRSKAIAFVIPNQITERHLSSFAVSVDSLEHILGVDLFTLLYFDKYQEEILEESFDLKDWPVSEKRYKMRVESWNKNEMK